MLAILVLAILVFLYWACYKVVSYFDDLNERHKNELQMRQYQKPKDDGKHKPYDFNK